MTDPLAQHVAIVKQALREGVTERDDLIRAVLDYHVACKHYWWTAKDCAMMVDVALAEIERMKKNERKS